MTIDNLDDLKSEQTPGITAAAEHTSNSLIDVHKAELHVAMLSPDTTTPVTWTV